MRDTALSHGAVPREDADGSATAVGSTTADGSATTGNPATPTGTTPGQSVDERIDPQTRRVLIVLSLGGIAAVMDTTIVTIALHDLIGDMHSSVNTIQWVTTAYLLALTAAIPTVGWAEARLGGKRLWITALALFLAGSLLCAASWDPLSLILFRVIQGLGAGTLLTLMQTLAMRAARGRAAARVTAAFSLPIAIGPIVGPTLGGMLLTWAGWRWIFLINAPLCLAGIATAIKMLPDFKPAPGTPRPSLDLGGLMLLAPGLALVLFGLSRCGARGATASVTVASIAAGLVLCLGFLGLALRRGERALIDVRLFARRPVGSASLMMFLAGVTLFGAMLLLPLYWQELRGDDALQAALLLIPQGIGALLVRFFIARLTTWLGAPLVCFIAFAVATVATVPFALADGSTGHIWLAAVLVVRGLGMGAVITPIISSAYIGLERAAIPHASMQTRLMQQIGGAFGTAIAAVLLQALTSSGDPAGAFQGAFWVFTGLAAMAAFASFTLPPKQRPS